MRLVRFPVVSVTLTLMDVLKDTSTLTAIEVEGKNVESPL